MSQLSESRGRAAATRLLTVADRNLYRRNPFRITGLATGATGPVVRQERQRLLSEFASPPRSARLPLPEPPSKDELRKALDQLGNAERRLIAELFWVWDTPDGCGCAPEAHDDHDVAVLAHAAALDRPTDAAADIASWKAAAAGWSKIIKHEDLWAHLRYRVRTLGDRRLDESTVDGLRGALPRALIQPLVATVATASDPAALASCFDAWPADRDTIDDLRLTAADDTLERVTKQLDELRKLLDAKQPETAAQRALTDLVPAATALEKVLPHQRFRRSSTVREQVAIALNNCGVAFPDIRRWRQHVDTLNALFTKAAKFAVTAEAKQAIARNRASADRLIAMGGAWQNPSTGLSRVAAALGYVVVLVYLMVGVAAAAPVLTVLTSLVGGLLALRGIVRSWRRRALAYLCVAGAVVVPVAILAGARALPAGGLSAVGYLATLVLIIATFILRPR